MSGKRRFLILAEGNFGPLTSKTANAAVRYIPNLPHHAKWGNEFPNHFDTWISSGLLAHALKACGFKRIVRLRYRVSWLPLRWYFWHSALVAVR